MKVCFAPLLQMATPLALFACSRVPPSSPATSGIASVPAPGPVAAESLRPGGVRYIDGLVDVGSLSLHIHCVGDGAPIVVFDAGLGNDGSVWGRVQPEVGTFSRACAYDRAGLGYSQGSLAPHHSNRQMARELYALLKKADQEPPYVLVGHSMGGMNVRLLTSEHNEDVAGMVLVDAVGDDVPNRFWSLLPAEQMADFRSGVGNVEPGFDYETFAAGFAELRGSSRSLGAMPLVVLTHGKESREPGVSPELAGQLDRSWREMQSELALLSSNSLHLVARNSSHFIQVDEPRLVSASIRAVVDAVRAHASIDPRPLMSLASKYESH